MGIEPTALAWEARVLPLYDAREGCHSKRGWGSLAIMESGDWREKCIHSGLDCWHRCALVVGIAPCGCSCMMQLGAPSVLSSDLTIKAH